MTTVQRSCCSSISSYIRVDSAVAKGRCCLAISRPGALPTPEDHDVPRCLVNLCLYVIHCDCDYAICEHCIMPFGSILLCELRFPSELPKGSLARMILSWLIPFLSYRTGLSWADRWQCSTFSYTCTYGQSTILLLELASLNCSSNNDRPNGWI